jgi:phosphoribosylanthranilate isomerase
VFVKICGITREDDALLAVAMGADAVGFIFAPSQRQIAPSIARDIARRLPPEILTVGVFRDEAPSRVIDIVNTAGLRAAQLSGHESADDTHLVRSQVPYVIKAFSAGSPDLLHLDEFGADAVMVDSPEPGSGETFDWSLLDALPRPTGSDLFDGSAELRLILAGGLRPETVADAIYRVQPWGVDVATGVEAERGEPGQKDARKVKRFIEEAKAAGERVARGEVPPPTRTAPPVASGAGPALYDWMEDDGS